jgi:hypothetical protein
MSISTVEALAQHQVDRLLAVAGQHHAGARLLQQLLADLLAEHIVLDQQDAGAGDLIEHALRHRLRRGAHEAHAPGQARGKPEGAAHARGAVDPDAAAHQLDELLADHQAEAGAAVLAGGRRVRLVERLEQLGHLRGRHADAAVLHLEAHHGVAGRIAQRE